MDVANGVAWYEDGGQWVCGLREFDGNEPLCILAAYDGWDGLVMEMRCFQPTII